MGKEERRMKERDQRLEVWKKVRAKGGEWEKAIYYSEQNCSTFYGSYAESFLQFWWRDKRKGNQVGKEKGIGR